MTQKAKQHWLALAREAMIRAGEFPDTVDELIDNLTWDDLTWRKRMTKAVKEKAHNTADFLVLYVVGMDKDKYLTLE